MVISAMLIVSFLSCSCLLPLFCHYSLNPIAFIRFVCIPWFYTLMSKSSIYFSYSSALHWRENKKSTSLLMKYQRRFWPHIGLLTNYFPALHFLFSTFAHSPYCVYKWFQFMDKCITVSHRERMELYKNTSEGWYCSAFRIIVSPRLGLRSFFIF